MAARSLSTGGPTAGRHHGHGLTVMTASIHKSARFSGQPDADDFLRPEGGGFRCHHSQGCALADRGLRSGLRHLIRVNTPGRRTADMVKSSCLIITGASRFYPFDEIFDPPSSCGMAAAWFPGTALSAVRG